MKFYPLEHLHRLAEGYQQLHQVAGRQVLLLHQDGQSYLFENRCPHQDASLEHAHAGAGIIRCPVHGFEFKLKNGQAVHQPHMRLTQFTPVYDGKQIGIELP